MSFYLCFFKLNIVVLVNLLTSKIYNEPIYVPAYKSIASNPYLIVVILYSSLTI